MYKPDEQFYADTTSIVAKLNALLSNKECIINKQPAKIETVQSATVLIENLKPVIDIKVSINCNSIIRNYFLYTSLNLSISLSDELKTQVLQYKPRLEEINQNAIKRAREAEEILNKLKAEEQAKIEAEKKAKIEAEKLEKLNNKFMYELNTISSNKPTINEDDIITVIGWLAKNASAPFARIPTIAENWFIKEFGDMKHTVVDPTRKTSGGYSMIFAPGFNMPINKKALDFIPKSISQYVTNGKLYNTALIYDLVKNYGFEFGKKPNYEDIIKTIPDAKLDNFNSGYQIGI